MEIIPVIDLLDHQVVHARHGERKHYRPIASTLCSSSEPLPIMDALLALYPFHRIYVADINAIQKRSSHDSVIKSWLSQYPDIDLWLDNGITRKSQLGKWQVPGISCIIGSENLASKNDLLEILNHSRKTVILSLDSNRSGQLGPAGLDEEAEYWPDKVIVMTLSKVGSLLGPDFSYLEKILGLGRKQSSHIQIYAAGGIRNMDDLLRLRDMGISGALVATALQNGSITGEEIARLNGLDIYLAWKG